MRELNKELYKELDSCPICQSKNINFLLQMSWDGNKANLNSLGVEYFYPKWSFCDQCSHVFLNPRFSDSFEKKLYADGSVYRTISQKDQSTFEYMKSIDNTIDGSAKFHKTHFQTLKKVLKSFKDVEKLNFLDFGAGWGSCATAAEALNIKYRGLELDPWCIDQAKKLGRNVSNTFENYENLDLVYSFQVFEHINNPREILSKFIHKMKVGSYIFTNVPTYEFSISKNWGIGGLDGLNWLHSQSYSRQSLIYLFELYGFEMERVWLGEGDLNLLMKKTNKVSKLKKKNQNSLKRKKIAFKFHKNFLVSIHSFSRLPKKILKKILKK